jgi:hypothetical protein
MTLKNSLFKMNLAATGGAVQLERNSRLSGTNMRLMDNIALLQGGALNILQNAHVNLSKAQFIGNYADSASVVNLLGSFAPQNIIFENTLFFRNKAIKNTIQI